MYGSFQTHLQQQLSDIDAAGLTKRERVILSPQDAHISVNSGVQVLNMCANNYLGLAEHPTVKAAAAKGLEEWGFGLASVRFICGTQGVHKELEKQLSSFSRNGGHDPLFVRASMPTVDCSKHCLGPRRPRSSRTN